MAQVSNVFLSSQDNDGVQQTTETAFHAVQNELHGNLTSKIGRILCLMRLTGAFYGDTSLNEERQINGANSNLCSRLYCGFVLLGQWTLVFMVLMSLFFEGLKHLPTFFLLLIAIFWCTQNAVVSALSLYIFPNRSENVSPFCSFLRSLCSNATETDLGRVTKQAITKLMALTCLVFFVNTSFVVLLDVFQQNSLTKLPPWNESTVCRCIIFLIFAYNGFTWTLPLCTYCISCSLLESMFDNLQKVVTTEVESSVALSVQSLRKKHRNLCETVTLANKVYSPILCAEISLDIPLLCVLLNQLVRAPTFNTENIIYFISVLYWCCTITTKLAVILNSAVRVNDKVRFS